MYTMIQYAMLILSLLPTRCPAFQPNLLGRPSAYLLPFAQRHPTSSTASSPCFSSDKTCRRRLYSSRVVKSESLESDTQSVVPLYRSEGLFAVNKPLEWTSQDVVSYIRGILERDARIRGAQPARVTDRRNKNRAVRVGHGGTLDPLATGVLVIGVGKGTKELQRYVGTETTVRRWTINFLQ